MVHAQVGDNVFARSALARQLLHPTPGLPFSILLYTQAANVPPSSGVPALRPRNNLTPGPAAGTSPSARRVPDPAARWSGPSVDRAPASSAPACSAAPSADAAHRPPGPGGRPG